MPISVAASVHRYGSAALALLFALSLTGCSVDLGKIPVLGQEGTGGTDSGLDSGRPPMEGGGPETGPNPAECLEAPLGEPCAGDGMHICVQGECVESTCGDGFVDEALGEECEGDGTSEQPCVRCKACSDAGCDMPPVCPPGHTPMPEICNGVNDDCDENIDEDVVQELFVDADGDGYGHDDMTVPGCDLVDGLSPRGGDCDDAEPAVNPGVTETCNGMDDDCNGATDDGIACGCTHGDTLPCGPPDGSGGIETRGLCEAGIQTCSNGSYGGCVGDIWPAAGGETCDGTSDEDCDDKVDELVHSGCWADGDGDGFATANAAMTFTCTTCGAGRTAIQPTAGNVDCNDSNASVKPGAAEVCNGTDDDCDTSIDDGIVATCSNDVLTTCVSGSPVMTDCAAAGGVCTANACRDCAIGSFECQGTDSYECNGLYAWALDDVCSVPAELCGAAGTCVANPIRTLGHATSTGGTVQVTANTSIWATRVVNNSTRSSAVLELGILGAAAGGGARVAIYSEGAAGYPANLLLASAGSVTVTASEQTLTLNGGYTMAPNTAYWVAALVDGAPTLYRYTKTGQIAVWTSGVAPTSFPAAFPLNGNTSVVNDREYSIFTRVRDIP
jgi:hypothetical protein